MYVCNYVLVYCRMEIFVGNIPNDCAFKGDGKIRNSLITIVFDTL